MSEVRRVTIRIKRDLHKEYLKYLTKKDKKIKEDMNIHIQNQTDDYKIPEYKEIEYSNMEYSKISFDVDKQKYADYKIVLIDNSTTPTADVTRYISKVVQE